MNFVIRTDASLLLGSGHVMRCLVLAEELKTRQNQVSFICRRLPGHLCKVITGKGYAVYELDAFGAQDGELERLSYDEFILYLKSRSSDDAEQTEGFFARSSNKIDWLIVDHYGIDKRWEARLRSKANKILVIDDLADREHDCDLLLDQNLYADMDTRYDRMVPQHCVKLLGPRYALLRSEFFEERKKLRERNGSVHRILVFLGGSDQYNVTSKVLRSLSLLGRPDIGVDVVVGGNNPHRESIREYCETANTTTFHCQTDNMAALMGQADLAIGAGGSSTWERCFLGLPAITINFTQNQVDANKAVEGLGAVLNAGWHADVTAEQLATVIEQLIRDPASLRAMGRQGMTVMGSTTPRDGSPIVRMLLEANEETSLRRGDFRLKPLAESDLEQVLAWRNSDRIRAVMYTDHVISRQEHWSWYEHLLRSDNTRVMIFESGGRPLGVVTITDIDQQNQKCLWGFYLGETDAPRNSALIMGYLGLDYLFNNLRIRKVCGEVFAFNQKSIQYHERLGFTAEGRLKQHILKNGVYQDVIPLALFRDQWLVKVAEIERTCFTDANL